MYEEENRSDVPLGQANNDISVPCPYCGSNLAYRDKHGEIWVRASRDTVRRLSDGHLGGWFGGQGLINIQMNHA